MNCPDEPGNDGGTYLGRLSRLMLNALDQSVSPYG
jgi:hypothetical protein